MNRLRLAAFIVATIASMAWLVSLCAADEPLYFPTVNIPAPIKPTPLVNLPGSPDSSPREVVLVVPNFPCGACQYLEAQILTLPNVRLRKVVDMTRPSWPWLSVPDTGHEWRYQDDQGRLLLTAKSVGLILQQYPPIERPVVAAHARSSKWPAVRDAYLVLHPACEACGSRDDLDVHHVKPFHIDPTRELDPTNLITLCSSDRTPDNGAESRNCHLHIGHKCADGRGRWTCENPDVRKDAADARRKIHNDQGAK